MIETIQPESARSAAQAGPSPSRPRPPSPDSVPLAGIFNLKTSTLIYLITSYYILLHFLPPPVSAVVLTPSLRAPIQSGDTLDAIKANQSPDERIAQLKQFISSRQSAKAEMKAREMLMQEYFLKGEQALKEGVPGRAMVDFKSVLEAAPAEIPDTVFEKYIFPLPIAMNTFGYRLESVELMQSFEPR